MLDGDGELQPVRLTTELVVFDQSAHPLPQPRSPSREHTTPSSLNVSTALDYECRGGMSIGNVPSAPVHGETVREM